MTCAKLVAPGHFVRQALFLSSKSRRGRIRPSRTGLGKTTFMRLAKPSLPLGPGEFECGYVRDAAQIARQPWDVDDLPLYDVTRKAAAGQAK
jgi:hypothetical protein